MNITPTGIIGHAEKSKEIEFEQKLKDLFFGLADAVLLINFSSRQIIDANIHAEKMLGYEAGELFGRYTRDVYPDAHVYEQVGKAGEDIISQHRGDHFNLVLKKKNGDLLSAEAFVLPLFDEAIQQHRGIIIFQNKADFHQNDLDARYRAMSQNSRDIVLFVEINTGRILDANRIALNTYGYTYDELLKLRIDQIGKNGDPGFKINRKAYSSAVIHEAVHCRKDGSTFPVEVSFQDTRAADDRVLVVIVRDVTSRFQAENARQASDERYRLLFNSMMDGFALHEMVYDKQGKPVDYRFIEVNLAYYALHNLMIEINRKLASEVFQDNETGPIELYDRVARTGIPAYFEHYYPRLDRYIDVMVFSPLKGQFATIMTDITARKKAEAEIQRQFQRLEALRLVDSAIATSFNLQIIIKILLDQVTAKLGADAVALLTLNVHNQMLEYESVRGFRCQNLEHTNISHDDGLIIQIMDSNAPLIINQLSNSPHHFGKQRQVLMVAEDFHSYCGVPVVVKGHVRAVIETYFRKPFIVDDDWLSYLNTLASQAAIAIDNTEMFEGMQRSSIELTRAYEATIESWAHSLDIRCQENPMHTYQVTQMTVRLARRLGMGDEDIVHVRRGAILHDIGKTGIPDQILLKTGPLTPDEWKVMRHFPIIAYELISHVPYLLPAMDIPYSHHEHWDGSGYPLGLKKNAIPLAARIFAVVETWNVMRLDRPYRKAWMDDAVIEYIRDQSGARFDPAVVDEFFKMLGESGDR
ncbi:MAG: PAS domain S-box protein [Anaerolineae bacterium]|nr:PAS domain S-box protein [Anaerolineae bacterium]